MSFFKRAVVGALERREEVRDANQLKYESDVTVGITKLNEAEKAMAKNELIVRNRKKSISPILLEVKRLTGQNVSMAVGINAFQKTKGDTEQTIQSLRRMVEAQQPTTTFDDGTDAEINIGSTQDYTDLSGDTTKALQDSSSMISTTSTKLPTQQKSERDYREQRYGGGVTGNIMNTLLGGASGPSVRNAVRERYSSMFRTREKADQAYTKAMDYMEQLRTTGDPTNIPDLPPEELRQLNMYTNIEMKSEKFSKNLVPEVDRQTKAISKILLSKVTGNPGLFNVANFSAMSDGPQKSKLLAIVAELDEEKEIIASKAIDLFDMGQARNVQEAVRTILNSKPAGENQPSYKDNLISRLTKQAGLGSSPKGTASSGKSSTPPKTSAPEDVSSLNSTNKSVLQSDFGNQTIQDIVKRNTIGVVNGNDNIQYSKVRSESGKIYYVGRDPNAGDAFVIKHMR